MTSFIAKPRELFDRFDPKYVAFKRRAANFRYPAVRMGSLLSEPPEYGAGEAGIERVDEATPRYIRITDIDENGELLPGLGMTAANVEPQYFLRDGDLLFARSGNTVGKSYLHESGQVPYPCFYAGYMIRFRFGEKVLPKYVFAFTQTPYYHEWVSAIQRSAGQPNINAQEYRSLEIPLPPLPEQRKIVAELDAAYAAKRAADEKATKLLASIDDMVLSELGIAKLPKPDTSLSSRIFTVPAREVLNGRLDPYSYSPFFADNLKRIRSNGSWRLGELVTLSHRQWDQREWQNGVAVDFPYIEIGTISVDDGVVGRVENVPIVDAPSRAKMMVEAGDLLVSLTRPTRRAIAFAQNTAIASTGFAVIHDFSEEVIPKYLSVILRSELCAYQFDQRSTGGNYPAITEEQLLQCEIPMASKVLQSQIVTKVSSIHDEVHKLKADANAELEAAKRMIEEKLVRTEE